MSQDEGRDKLDATGEFFSVGAPLHAVRAGYIKRRADDLLYETVAAGRYAHILAPARSGKSSLIAATAARLENNGCKVAILDLEQIGVRDGGTDSGRWYYNVAYRMLRQLRIRYDLQSWWQDKSVLGNRQRLLEFYSEVLLQNISDRAVIFVDEIQCIENLPYADQLLASIRAAHNARTTDPDFQRLCFVLSGECDPVSLIGEPELSPFNVTQAVQLDDFERDDLELFATEMNLDTATATIALDRIYYWTAGQPYLTQKLTRAVARESLENMVRETIEDEIDHIALHQLAGRAALHSEPHMSHIHRRIVSDSKDCEPLLNLYGRLRKGIEVPADLGSPMQRRLMAVGLVLIDEDGRLMVRNRLYGAVFTTRWANENLPTRLRVPLLAAAGLLLFALLPFWYTQWLPGPYVRVLAEETSALPIAHEAFEDLASFPGHSDTALNLYRDFLERRARATTEVSEIRELARLLAELPETGRLPEEIEGKFWDRHTAAALRDERRDVALLSSLRALALPTAARRQRAASLVGDDYPLLLASLPPLPDGKTVFDPLAMVLTTAQGAKIFQWSYTPQGLQQRGAWTITALEVVPLLRRVFVDREGTVSRIGLTLNISHARLVDLRIKIIAPSGRTVEIETGMEQASSSDDIRVPAEQLRDLVGESMRGTWSISVRDETLGVAGQLVGWNLKLNSQGAVEYFQRGLNIPDPVERETDNLWFDRSGRYAVARALQSDSARIWDLSFSEPVRAIAVSENETLIGLDSNARRLITATQDSVNVWDTATGDKIASLPVGAASPNAELTPDGRHLFVMNRGDVETRLELWSLDEGALSGAIEIAGAPAHVAIDAGATRVAVADFDRAIRIWDFATDELLAQLDLAMQPSELEFSADGQALGATYAGSGVSLWSIAFPERPLLEETGGGGWQFEFSPSGALFAAGRSTAGYQVYSSRDGSRVGPTLGLQKNGEAGELLAFSGDEQLLLTGSAAGKPRFWRTPTVPAAQQTEKPQHIRSPSGNRVLLVTPDAESIVIGDPDGHVHVLPAGASLEDVALASGDVSFLGHTSEIRGLATDTDARYVASVATDNSIRVWRTTTGEPLAWIAGISGAPVEQMQFSPNAGSLALVGASNVSLLDVDTGSLLTTLDFGDAVGGISFATPERFYVGTDKGVLHLVERVPDGHWRTQQVWQGETAIRTLEVAPRGDFMILVDADNRASQFVLSEGRIAENSLRLPSDVEEVVFDTRGARVWLRTTRWVHVATPSVSGLHWQDAMLVPPTVDGAGIVFRSQQADGAPRALLPVARNGFVELSDVSAVGSGGGGLFGNRDELLRDWQSRVSAYRREGFSPVIPAWRQSHHPD